MRFTHSTILSVLFLSFFFCLPISAEYFQKIGLSDGLTQPSVMSITQDKLGRMWFGTLEGINMFDGETVTPYKGWVRSSDSTIWLGNEITNITSDKNGNLFFMADDDLMKYELYTEQFFRLSDDRRTQGLTSYEGEVWFMRNDTIYTIDSETQSKSFYAVTDTGLSVYYLLVTAEYVYIAHQDGLYIIDRKNQQTKNLLEGIHVQYLFESSQKELWIGTRLHGMYWMDRKGMVHKVPFILDSPKGIKSHQIRQFVEDNDHNVWFGTFDGLHKYDITTHEYKLIKIPEKIGGLTHSSIYSMYKDQQGIIWVGTYWGGVNYCNPKDNNYVFYKYDLPEHPNTFFSYLGDVTLDKDSNLWICTDGGGLTCMNERWEVVHRLMAGTKNSILQNNVKDIAYDKEHDVLYIGTYLGGLSRFDRKTGKVFNYLTEYDKTKVSPGTVVNFVKVLNGKVYTMGEKGFFVLDIERQLFKRIPLPDDFNQGFDIDKDENLYVIGGNSFAYLNLNSPHDITTVSLETEGCKSMLTNLVVRDDGVVVSSLGSGIFHYNLKSKQIHHYSTENNFLPSDYCYNLCLTSEDNVLISTDKGVTYYNPKTDKISTVDFKYYFPNIHIIKDCGLLSGPDGTVFVGSTKGLVTFKEREFHKIKTEVTPTDFYFNSLEVDYKHIIPKDGTDILSVGMPFTSSIQLASHQNNLTIGFASSDYDQNLTGKSFKYKLEGLHHSWFEAHDKKVFFQNLRPGVYQLRVAMLNYDRVVDEIKLQIYIAAPWYNTWWAWMIYILVIGLIVNAVMKNRIAKQRLAMTLANERKEKEHIEQLNHEKLVFFTNVSHEFRTPLTLLISHVDILLQKHSVGPTIYNQILKIRKNAEQMNNLISELLEFRKLTLNHQKLQLSQQDVANFLKETFLPFADYAKQRGITYENRFPLEPVVCVFDARLMAKVVFNLLSNAFKYTPDGGKIILEGRATPDEVEFSVRDTGVGLSEKDVAQIFVRFYQGDNQQKNKVKSPGTGIGLSLCKTIVEHHHGDITVESVVDEGSVFTVRLKRSADCFKDDQYVEFVDASTDNSYVVDPFLTSIGSELLAPEQLLASEEHDEKEKNEDTDTEKKEHSLLLVEDNVELLQILIDLFTPFYKVFTATNGEEGLQQVFNNKIDLIISDVMMPKMSGTEMCLQLKNNIDYCHIPIILLTALNSTEQNMQGLSRGADDYVTKPFHAGLLLARANNLIRSRLLMQHQFDKRPMSEIDLTSINPLDQELLKKVTGIIEAHIDDPMFDIPMLCQELGISRSLIFAKFKALTGMTPNNFILNFRLKFAATLLKQYKTMPISEVSDRCGFSSPVYFSQCFKKQFGMTPHHYRKEGTSGTE